MNVLIWVILAILLIFYLIVIPVSNQRKIKQDQEKMKEFQAKLESGNEIVMANGIHGKIKKLGATTAFVEVAPNVVIEVERTVIVGVKH